jgi:hypothetical protein
MALITSQREIPKARFYVLSNDTFMSGWGMSEGRINTCILPCRDMAEAERVAAYARSRTDTTRVRIAGSKPRLTLDTHTYSLMSREDATAWYGSTDDA